MYQFKVNGNLVDILWNNKVVIEGISPVITFESGNKGELSMKETITRDGEDKVGSYNEYVVKYDDSKDTLFLDISFKSYKDNLTVSVDAKRKFDAFSGVQAFSAVGGVRLNVKSIGNIEGLLANYLFSPWWSRPYFKRNVGELPSRTQSLLWKDSGMYHYLLPVCDDLYKTELCGNGTGMDVLVSSYTGGYNSCKAVSFVLGTGDDPYKLVNDSVSAGFKALGTTPQVREERRYPEILEYLGWCSWDAFYHSVNSAGIVEKAEEFKQQGLPVKWFMIDDGWSELKDGKLASFKEDYNKFPEGLSKLVENLKENYGVNWVGVWQNFLGYWNGIHPESEIVWDMKENIYTSNNGTLIPYPDAAKGFSFWNAWHSYVKRQGIEFVKVDNQSSLINQMKNQMAIGKAAKEAHTALEASLGINFDNCVINCMGMATEELWNRLVSAVSRNSDDFYPKRENGFKEHAFQNVYNSFYHGNFVWGDWDMWWTQHESALSNGVLRAVSGGPLYTSDSVNKTDPAQLWPLIMADGRILRCDRPGMPTVDCLTENTTEEVLPLKIWNTSNNCGIIAAFNINLEGKLVKGVLSPADVPGLKGEKFIIYDWFAKKVQFVGREDKIDIFLDNNGIALYIIVPAVSGCTAIGLVDKYISPAAVADQIHMEEKAAFILKDGGVFGFVADKTPGRVLVNGKEYAFEKKDHMFTVDCSGLKGTIYIEII